MSQDTDDQTWEYSKKKSSKLFDRRLSTQQTNSQNAKIYLPLQKKDINYDPGIDLTKDTYPFIESLKRLDNESVDEFKTYLPVTIDEKSPDGEYKRRDKYDKDNASEKLVHWGQLKLLMSEINFFNTLYQSNGNTWPSTLVVYAGAAPGTHICYLSMMFPELQFVLIDPRDIEFPKCYSFVYNTLYVSEGITHDDIETFLENNKDNKDNKDGKDNKDNKAFLFIKGCMSPELAKLFAGRNAIFISDIRSIEAKEYSEIAVLYDSLLHIDIIKQMIPSYSLIKSHCTYNGQVSENLEEIKKAPDGSHASQYRQHKYYQHVVDGKYSSVTPFPMGVFYTQCWAGLSSSETRLFVKGSPNIVTYDNKKFEDKMYYYNNVRRIAYYPELVSIFSQSVDKMNNSLDTHFHIYIVLKYMCLFDPHRLLLTSIINHKDLRQINTCTYAVDLKDLDSLEFTKYLTNHMCKNITLTGKRTLEWREWKEFNGIIDGSDDY